jgi:3-deoxy-D-manno-octulosonate 8-phosphate phosphatase (KDO 8-P phosphatase)
MNRTGDSSRADGRRPKSRRKGSGNGDARGLFGGVRGLVLDVDGVLTDGTEYWGRWGERLKRFNTLDGKGVDRLLKAGVKVFVISGEDSPISRRYARSLGIHEVSVGVADKCKVLRELARKHRLPLDTLAYMGDDSVDLPCMEAVGLPIAVPNAVPEVLEMARYVTAARGGRGAVREVADRILLAAEPPGRGERGEEARRGKTGPGPCEHPRWSPFRDASAGGRRRRS